MAARPTSSPRRLLIAVATLTTAIFLGTAPGRVPFPDDEIVFQTTQALWEDGTLEIPGIEKRSGEVDGQERGTFGWAPGVDGKRYGFFGHGLSWVALPFYGLGVATAERVPSLWRYAIRPDHHAFHRRDQRSDWTRLCVSLTNCVISGLTAALLLAWLRRLGLGLRAATMTALAWALGTLAWAFTRTFLSEPLSALTLLAAAYGITRWHQARAAEQGGAGWIFAAAAAAGFAPHVHVLNLSAWPCLLGYAVLPLWREGRLAAIARERRALAIAAAIAVIGLGLLGLDQFIRFGSPLETGRLGRYSHFVAPWIGMLALLVAPGRSLFVYAPAVALGLPGASALRRRLPIVAGFALAMVALRWVTIATRSDWFGGWAVGPRHLVPVLPFAVLPLALVWERFFAGMRGWARALVIAGHVGAVALSGYLAAYSIFDWMFRLSVDPGIQAAGIRMIDASHWWPSASPIAGYHTLKPDILAVGAAALAERGEPTLLWVFYGVGVIGLVAAAVILRALLRPEPEPT
ncbi:MAG: hypothetical protein R3B09_12255 [Nannocystaceae bacterium]